MDDLNTMPQILSLAIGPRCLRSLALGLAVSLLVGCGGGDGAGGPGPYPTGETEDAIVLDGIAPRFYVFVPSAAGRDNPVPLVISLHGGGGSADGFEQTAQIQADAGAAGIAVVRVEGYATDTELLTWNAGVCCGGARRDEVDHVGAIAAIIDRVTARVAIDASRIAAVGHSNGGMMAYRLGCQLSERITHVGVSAGYLVNQDLSTDPPTTLFECTPSRPFSVIHFHGLQDTCAPFEGGEGAGVVNDERPPVADTIAQIRAANQCASVFNDMVTGAGELERRTLTGCAEERVVQLNTVDSAGHVWFGATEYPSQAICEGSTTSLLSANQEIFRLLRDNPR